MPDVDGTPSDAQLLKAAVEWAMRRTRVHLPATVEEYDDKKGVVSARVDVGEYVDAGDGEVAVFEKPLPFVPVMWVGGGGARGTFPLERGDTGLLLFSDRALEEWKANRGQVVARAQRTHHLADAVFLPGLRPPAAAWKGEAGGPVRTDAVTLGYEGAQGAEGMQLHITKAGIALGEKDPAYAVALAEKVHEQLQVLMDALTNAVPGAGAADGGAALQASLLGLLNQAGFPGPVNSTTVKVKG